MVDVVAVRVRLTEHARARAAEMGVGTKEVKRTLRDPDVVYRGGLDYPDTEIAAAGRLAVPFRYDGDVRVGLTVLWNSTERWER